MADTDRFESFEVAGWGDTRTENSNDHLQKLNHNFMDIRTCRRKWRGRIRLDKELHVCVASNYGSGNDYLLLANGRGTGAAILKRTSGWILLIVLVLSFLHGNSYGPTYVPYALNNFLFELHRPVANSSPWIRRLFWRFWKSPHGS